MRDSLAKTLFRHNWILPVTRRKRFIFLFHDVSPSTEPHHHPAYSVTSAVFYDQIRALQSLFDLVSLDVLCDEEVDPDSNRAAVVFDDGFLSVGTTAAPYLFDRGIPFAVFVNKQALQENRLWCTDVVLGASDSRYLRSLFDRYVGPSGGVSYEQFEQGPLGYLVPAQRLRDDYAALARRDESGHRVYLSATELQNLSRNGVLVGSHTVSHRVMTKLSDEAVRIEIEENRHYLESLLQKEIAHFAFPFGFHGAFDERAARCARSHHRYLHSTKRVFFERQDLKLDGLILPRLGLRSESRAEILSAANLAFFVDRRSQLVV